MKREIGRISMEIWELQEFIRGIPKGEDFSLCNIMHHWLKFDLAIFWNRMLYTKEERNLACYILEQMRTGGELIKILHKEWTKMFGKRKTIMTKDGDSGRFTQFTKNWSEIMIQTLHKKALKHLEKLSH